MEVLIAFLTVCFLVGGTRRGRLVRPIVLLGFCCVVAASFYSLRVVL